MEDHSEWRKKRGSGMTKIEIKNSTWGGIPWEYVTPVSYHIPQIQWRPAVIYITVKGFWSSSCETDQTERQNENLKNMCGIRGSLTVDTKNWKLVLITANTVLKETYEKQYGYKNDKQPQTSVNMAPLNSNNYSKVYINR